MNFLKLFLLIVIANYQIQSSDNNRQTESQGPYYIINGEIVYLKFQENQKFNAASTNNDPSDKPANPEDD